MPQGWDLGVPWGIGVNFSSSEIQPELLCELLTGMAHATALSFGSLPPWGLGEGPKGKISLNLYYEKKVSEYDQEILQSQTADNPVAPRGRTAQPSRDTRKTN